IDTTLPNISFEAPTGNDSDTVSRSFTYINVSITEKNLESVLLEWNGVNESMSGSENIWFKNKTAVDGTYAYRVYVTDLAGNANQTALRTITLSGTRLKIDFVPPTDGNSSVVSRNYTYINVSINATNAVDTAILAWNGVNETMQGSGLNWFVNKTDLADGTYTYRVYANDSVGTVNYTDIRTVTVDHTPPALAENRTLPAKPFFRGSFIIEVNATDANIVSVNFTVNSSDGTQPVINSNASAHNGDFWNSSPVSVNVFGTWNWSATAIDLADNRVEASGRVLLLGITESLNASSVITNDSVAVSGLVNFSNSTNLSGLQVNVTINSVIYNGSTDENGLYNITVTAPASAGTYSVTVNTTYEGYLANNSLALSVSTNPPVINSNATIPGKPFLNGTFVIQVNATDVENDIVWLNFTVNRSDGSQALANVNASNHTNDLWNSSLIAINVFGTWNYSVRAIDSSGNADEGSGSIILLGITEAFNNSLVLADESIAVFGRVNFSNNSAVANATVNVTVNGTTLGGNTDAQGEYNVTINAPVASGAYPVTVNVSYSGFFANYSRSITVTGDDEGPTWKDNRTNASSPKVGEILLMNVTLEDDFRLGHYVFSWNESGSWQNDSLVSISGTSYNVLVSKNITANSTPLVGWRVYFNDSFGKANATGIFTFKVGNSAPLPPNLSTPASNDSSYYNRTPAFSWENATDPDNDSLNYQFQLSLFPDFSSTLQDFTTSNSSWPYPGILDLNVPYYWRVRANDGTDYSQYPGIGNFTVYSLVSVSLPKNNVSFQVLLLNQVNDTVYGPATPMSLRNDGNTEINITFNGTPLFLTAAFNSSYFQVKANESTEPGAYNTTYTPQDWSNVSTEQKDLLRMLGWQDSADEAEVEVRVQVPSVEPAGSKISNMTFISRSANG
ncbi:carboxypeptidase regulatory-like domain-containing protein, partial [Candidatus Woesearchaeota archaeon]|nr:carboxypeptidase regulatory-like domain-containing protein [Candidatus Woesearchaeota archaeon]